VADLPAQHSNGETGVPAGPVLPFAFARDFGVVGIDEVRREAAPGDGRLTVVCKAQPTLTTLAALNRVTKRRFVLKVVSEEEFEACLTEAYARDASATKQMVADIGEHLDLASLADSVPETEDLLDAEADAPIVQLINALLAEAIREGASDVHIETFERDLVVRFRVDGVLREAVRPKRAVASLLVSRIKVMAKLDIAEKRVPQGGRIALRIGGREVDVRVSTLPSAHGERVVLRLLDKQAGRLTLEVRDDLCDWNNGRFELEGSADGATCRATDSSPDLSVAISGLASAYLGTVSFTTLSDAGLADEHTPGALHRADRMFAVQHQPWTPFNF